MRRFVNFYHFYLRIAVYSLPFLSFSVAGYARILTGHADVVAGINPYSYFNLVLLTTVVWAMIAEHFGVAGVQTLFRERTGIRAAFPACLLNSVAYVSCFQRRLFVFDGADSARSVPNSCSQSFWAPEAESRPGGWRGPLCSPGNA